MSQIIAGGTGINVQAAGVVISVAGERLKEMNEEAAMKYCFNSKPPQMAHLRGKLSGKNNAIGIWKDLAKV